MAGIKRAEAALHKAALEFAINPEAKDKLNKAAWRYGKAKARGSNKRDRWKEKKRIRQGGSK